MPKLCSFANCRNRINKKHGLYCTAHKDFKQPTINLCCHPDKSPLYKNLCASCFKQAYPYDPLTYQLTYKSHFDAISQFIKHHFDGFSIDPFKQSMHLPLQNHILCICVNTPPIQTTYKHICICINTYKYTDHNNKTLNPMLFHRLQTLLQVINTQIEAILTNSCISPNIIHLYESNTKFDSMNFSK